MHSVIPSSKTPKALLEFCPCRLVVTIFHAEVAHNMVSQSSGGREGELFLQLFMISLLHPKMGSLP